MPNNSLCITKITSLFLGLQDTFDDKVSRNQSSSPMTYSFCKDVLVVVIIVAIRLEGGNIKGSKKSGHSKPGRRIFWRKGIFAG